MDVKKTHSGSSAWAVDKDTRELKDISSVAKGKACRCVCPGCDWPVEAVHPKEKIRKYFRHCKDSSGNSRECTNKQGAWESIIHMFVKKFIGKLPRLHLPCYVFGFPTYHGYSIAPVSIFPDQSWEITDQIVEDYSISKSYVPDISCSFPRGKLAIEIFCTNPVGDEKLMKMKSDNLHVLEINCSDINVNELGSDLINRRLYSEKYSRWLHVPLTDVENRNIKKWYEDKKTEIDKILDKKRIKAEAYERAKLAAEKEKLADEEINERKRYVLKLDSLFFSLRREAEERIVKTLIENKGSPYTEKERKELWEHMKNIDKIAISAVSGCKFKRADMQKHPVTENLSGEILRLIFNFQQETAERMAVEYMQSIGRFHVEMLDGCGWFGNEIGGSLPQDEKVDDYFVNIINPEIDSFVEKEAKRFGVKYREMITS